MTVLYILFGIFKFLFGLGALAALLGIAAGLAWFIGHLIVRMALRNQPAESCPTLRRFFLETS